MDTLVQKNTLFSIVKASFPDLDEKKIRVFDDGWNFIVVVVNNELAFRFPRRNDFAEKLPIEVKFLDVFKKFSPVRIPELRYQKDKESGLAYVTYPYIPGVQFTERISSRFSKDELLLVAKNLGIFLTSLHSFPLERTLRLGVNRVNLVDSFKKQLVLIKKHVFPHISKNHQLWIIGLFEHSFSLVEERTLSSVLIHSDIAPEHIIVDPKTHSLSGIIDFGDIEIADPAYDFTFLELYGANFLNEVYKNYGLPRDDLFEKRRLFYRESKLVVNLKHSLLLKDRDKINLHKDQLSQYIQLHPK